MFENKDVAKRVRTTPERAREEISILVSAGVVKRVSFYKEVTKKVRGKTVTRKRKVRGVTLDRRFRYLDPLQIFLLNTAPLKRNDIAKKLGKIGKLDLVVTAGVFIQNGDSRVDMLIVGDRIKRPVLESAIRDMESELGKELSYAAFSTTDFRYRLAVYDKLIRDILDYPHQTVVDRLGIT
jgi:hypothetical protein